VSCRQRTRENRKAGPYYDLPIAVGILLASDQLMSSPGEESGAEESAGADGNTSAGVVPALADSLFLGELSLDGSVRHIRGVLKLARTIADLADSETIISAHVAEALQYRPRLHPGLE
jgi:predicted ATPase with chaperone activity